MWRPPRPSDKSLGYCQMSLRDKMLATRRWQQDVGDKALATRRGRQDVGDRALATGRWQQDVGVAPNRNGRHPVASRGVRKPDRPMQKSRTVAADRTGETQTRFRRLRRCRSRRAIPLRIGETENAISATAPTLFQPAAKPEGGGKPAPAGADGMPRTQRRFQPACLWPPPSAGGGTGSLLFHACRPAGLRRAW